MARPTHEKHRAQDEATEQLVAKRGLGCPHCLDAYGTFPVVLHDPRPLDQLRDLIRASRILQAPEEIPRALLASIRHAEDLLADIDQGETEL